MTTGRFGHAALLALLVCGAASAQPREVMLIRHAEKPDDGSSIHLSPAGQKRAEALPKLFDLSRPHPFPKPDFIFATKQSDNSNRPVETVTPLAKGLHLDVNSHYRDKRYQDLADELLTRPKYAGKVVLVCWHHGEMKELATSLRVEDAHKWPKEVFDQVWVISYTDGKAKLQLKPQALMPDDRE
jgi:hypothetical protein